MATELKSADPALPASPAFPYLMYPCLLSTSFFQTPNPDSLSPQDICTCAFLYLELLPSQTLCLANAYFSFRSQLIYVHKILR